MKVKRLCKDIDPGSMQASRHPTRQLLDRDESKGYWKKNEEKTQVYLHLLQLLLSSLKMLHICEN